MAIPTNLNALGNAVNILKNGLSGLDTNSINDILKNLGAQFSNLSQKQILNIASTKNLSAEYLTLALSSSQLTDEQKKNIITAYEQIVATKAQDAANKSATVSLTGLKNGFKGLWATMLANPITSIITIASVAIPTIMALVDHFTTTLEEQKEVVSNLSSEISSLQSEYEQLSSKTDLTDAEQRKLELLQAQLAVKKEQIALEAKKQEEKQFTSDVTDTVNDPDSGTVSYTQKGTRSQAYDEIGNYEAAKKSLEEYNAEIEKYSNVTGLSADKVKEANAALTSAQQSRDKATKQMSDAKSVIVDDIAALEDLKEKTGSLEPENQKLLDYLYKMATEFGFFTDSVETASKSTSNLDELTNSISSLQSAYDAIPDKLKDIDDIQSKLNDSYSFSYDEIEKIKAAHPELADAIHRTADGWTIEKSAVDALRESTLNLNTEFSSAQAAMTKIMQSAVASRLEGYGIELEAIKSLADAYNEINKKNAELSKQQTDLGVPHASLRSLDQEAYSTIIDVGKYQDTINDLKSKLSDLKSGSSISGGSSSKGTSSSSSSAAKTTKYENKALEEQLALLEHRKAMGEFDSDDLKKKAELSLQYVRELEKITKYTKTQDELNENREQVYQAYQDHYADVFAYQKEEYDNALKIIQSKKDYNLYENNSIQLSKDLLEVKRKYARTQEQIEEINKQIHDADRQALSEQEDAMKRAESAVERVIDKRIKALQEEQDALEKYYQKKIDRIQDEIDALQDANDERAKQLALEKAQAAWEAAQNQKTISIYRDGLGFVYEADQDAINEAGENLADAKLDIRLDELNKKKQDLEDSLKKEKQALQDSINDWEDYKDKWSDILNEYSNSQDELIMKQLLGKDAEADILDQRLDKLSEFRDKYIALQKEIAEFDGKAVKSSSSSSSSSKKSNGNIITKETYVDRNGSTRTHTTIRVDRDSLPASMIGGRASGDISVKRSGIYNVDEEGPEAILGAPTRGQYQWLHQNDKVFDADATKNLWDIANNPIDFISKRLGSVFDFRPKFQFASPDTSNKQVTNQYHIDKIDFPNATNTEQIQRAFVGLPDYFIQKSTSNL